MRISTFLSCLLLAVLASSQSFSQVEETWVQQFNASDHDRSVALKTNGSDVYVLGNSGFTSQQDIVLIKYNSAGQVLWTQFYNSPSNTEDAVFGPHSLAVDGAGSAYVVGTNQSGPLLSSLNIFVIKYSVSGAQQWVSTYASAFGAQGFGVAVDASGNVYICGRVATSSGFGDSTDYLIIKYNSLGVQQWVATYDGTAHSADMGTLITVDPFGNVYVSGESIGQHRKGKLIIPTNADIVTIKFNPSGKQLWVNSFNDRLSDVPHELLVDAAGNVYVTGENELPAPPNTNFLFDLDYITIKYNAGGTQKWLARFSGNGPEISLPQDMVLDASGNVYVTGGSHTLSSNDGLTIKYNASGIEQWQARYPDMSPNLLMGFTNIALDDFGGLYVSGTVEESGSGANFKTVKYSGSSGIQSWVATYNGPANGNDNVAAMGVFTPPGPTFSNAFVYVTGTSAGVGTGDDIATIRYSQPIIIGPEKNPATSAIETVVANQFKLSNYPNPFSGSTRIGYQLPYNSYVSIKVYDITGKEVATITEGQKSSGIHSEFFHIGRLSRGTYTYRIIANSSAGRFEQSKIMIAQ